MSHHAAVHGAWCNSRVFRMTCSDCGESVWYFTCNCGCKVFFDELGHPWPLHKERCYRAIMREHNISEEVARKMILGALKDQRKPIVAIDELFEKQIIQKKDFLRIVKESSVQFLVAITSTVFLFLPVLLSGNFSEFIDFFNYMKLYSNYPALNLIWVQDTIKFATSFFTENYTLIL